MKKRIKLLVLVFAISLIGITAYGKATEKTEEVAEQTGFLSNLRELGEISQIMDLILQEFVISDPENQEAATKERLLEGALKGMVEELGDPHSTYFTKKEMNEFNEDIAGEFAGVGMQINKAKDEYLNVVSPIEGTPAFEAGIKPHDKIVEIDGTSTLGLTTNDCMKMLRGEPKTKVTIKVFREGKEDTFDVTLERAIIELKYVKHSMLSDKVGLVRLTQFGTGVSKDVEVAIEDLLSQGMEGLIFDLRFNPGGSLEEAIRIGSLFIDKGVIVRARYKNEEETLYERKGKYLGDFPLIVLINGGSASASEIVAGAIKDHKRGLLVGEKSFGKGSVQNVIPLPNGGGIKLTIARFFSPNGTQIHKKGIQPDTLVEEEDDYLFFDGYITNVDEEAKKESKEELIDYVGKVKGEEEKEKLQKKEDVQLETAENILKGILLYKN